MYPSQVITFESIIPEEELQSIERMHPAGLTSHQIVELFAERGSRFSEASLRKYVQLGLLSRSRRVGLKGKHRGSQGLYPASTIRRISVIKQMMHENHTIEEVRDLLAQTFKLETVAKELEAVLTALELRLSKLHMTAGRKRKLDREIGAVRTSATELVERIETIEKRSRPLVKRPSVAVPPAPPRTKGNE